MPPRRAQLSRCRPVRVGLPASRWCSSWDACRPANGSTCCCKAAQRCPLALRPRLVVVGDGPERNGLEALAKTIYPAAEFPGAKHGTELAAHFSTADLFVLPGTGGLAVQEAMSYGLPVIMGQGDGTNDQLVRPGNGWQIPPDDITALVGTLHTALSDALRLRRMGAESYRIVRDEINLEKMVGVFVEALELVNVRRKP